MLATYQHNYLRFLTHLKHITRPCQELGKRSFFLICLMTFPLWKPTKVHPLKVGFAFMKCHPRRTTKSLHIMFVFERKTWVVRPISRIFNAKIVCFFSPLGSGLSYTLLAQKAASNNPIYISQNVLESSKYIFNSEVSYHLARNKVGHNPLANSVENWNCLKQIHFRVS